MTIEVEDSRCRNLFEGMELEVDDPRSRLMTVRMEDPRCQNLYLKW